MDILKTKKFNGTAGWQTRDGKFGGVLIDAVTMVEHTSGEKLELRAAALLAVPKYSKDETPSINKYSPVIAQADSDKDLGPLVSEWVDRNKDKSLWELRTR